MAEFILTERRDDIVTLTFNRPEKLNYMDREMGVQLKETCERLAGDESVRAVIITGGGRAFSAGGNLDWLKVKATWTAEENETEMLQFYPLFLAVRDIKAPVIAAINGPAIGAGLCLALACDIRLAARSANMGATFVKVGLSPGMGCTWTLPRIVGPQKALLLTLTGRRITAGEALEMGILEAVHDDETLMDEAMKLAREIASAAPMAVRLTKQAIWKGMAVELDEALKNEAAGQGQCFITEDVKEGIDAIMEKRKPVFHGK